jgi:hypothetical protein
MTITMTEYEAMFKHIRRMPVGQLKAMPDDRITENTGSAGHGSQGDCPRPAMDRRDYQAQGHRT